MSVQVLKPEHSENAVFERPGAAQANALSRRGIELLGIALRVLILCAVIVSSFVFISVGGSAVAFWSAAWAVISMSAFGLGIWYWSIAPRTHVRPLGNVGIMIGMVLIVGIASVVMNKTILARAPLLDAIEPSFFVLIFCLGWAVLMSTILFGRRFLQSAIYAFCGAGTSISLVLLASALGGGAVPLWFYESGSSALLLSSFLLLVFLGAQKKRIWRVVFSAAIFAHVAALFTYDAPFIWICGMAGVAILAYFFRGKAIKAKTGVDVYLVQVWVLLLVALVLPAATILGNSAPANIIESGNAFAFAKTHLVFNRPFGFGPGSGAHEYTYSHDVFSYTPHTYNQHAPVLQNSIAGVLIDYGWLGGGFIILLYLCIAVWIAYRSARAARTARSESSVPIEVGVGFAAVVLLVLGAYVAWSVYYLWFTIFFVAVFRAYMPITTAHAQSARASRVMIGAQVACVVGCCAAVLFHARFVYAAVIANRAASATSLVERGALLAQSQQLNPWNGYYALDWADTQIQRLVDGVPLDEQRSILEALVKKLSHLKDTSTDARVLWELARVYTRLESSASGSIILADSAYQKARAAWPENAALATDMAALYREYVDALATNERSPDQLRTEARAMLAAIIKRYPDYTPALLEQTYIIEAEDGVASAIAALVSSNATDPEVLYQIGRLQYTNGELSDALKALRVVTEVAPNHSNAWYLIGLIQYRQSVYQESLDAFLHVLELNPDSQDVQNKIKQVKEKGGIK